jgi:hypothetical protein
MYFPRGARDRARHVLYHLQVKGQDVLAATEHTLDGLEYRLHLVELSHVFAKGNLVVDIFAEVSAMTTMHEGF